MPLILSCDATRLLECNAQRSVSVDKCGVVDNSALLTSLTEAFGCEVGH